MDDSMAGHLGAAETSERPEIVLTMAQRRILGVLIEKSLTHPDAYPLTMNAVVSGCNQKTNRDPVVDFGESEVARVLHELQQMQLVRLAPPAPGARSNRFQHLVEDRLGWPKRYQAVLGELLLRGPQTAGELRTRAGRMVPFAGLDEVATLLEDLAERQWAEALPREPGRSAIRHAHMLYPPDESPVSQTSSTAAAVSIPPPVVNTVNDRMTEMSARIDQLLRRIEHLEQRLDSTQSS